MIERIKAVLNSTVFWLVALLSAVFYYRRKDQDLEQELEETKADETVKSDVQAVKQADSAASAADGDYTKLRDEYLSGHKDDA